MKQICACPTSSINFNTSGSRCILTTSFNHLILHHYDQVGTWHESGRGLFLNEEIMLFENRMVNRTHVIKGKEIKTTQRRMTGLCRSDMFLYVACAQHIRKTLIDDDILEKNLMKSPAVSVFYNCYHLQWDALHERILCVVTDRHLMFVDFERNTRKYIDQFNMDITDIGISKKGSFYWVKNKTQTNVFNNRTGQHIKCFDNLFDISPDEKLFLCFHDGVFCIGEVDGWKIMNEYNLMDVKDAKFNPDMMTFVIGHYSGAEAWDL